MKRFSSITRVNSRRTSPTKKRIGVIVIVGAVLLFLLWLIPQVFAFLAALILVPIQSSQTWLAESSSNFPMYLRDRAALVEENEQLREQLALDGGMDHTLDLFRRENEELRKLLGGEGEERTLAAIIGRPNTLPYDVLVVDRGSNDGIKQYTPVFIGSDQVIGVVAKVFPDSSVVELVSTPGLVSSVFIVGPDIYTNAIGVGGGQLRVGVPQGIALNVGDAVMLPAVAHGVYGTINHIESSETQPEQFGFVATDIPLQSLRYVSIGDAPITPITFEEAQAVVETGVNALFTVPVPEGVLVVTDSTSTATTTPPAATNSQVSTP